MSRSSWLRTAVGRVSAEVDPLKPPRDKAERSVVLLGPNDPEPDPEPGVQVQRLTFDSAPFVDARTGDWDLSKLTDEQLVELTAVVTRAEGKGPRPGQEPGHLAKRTPTKPAARVLAAAEPERAPLERGGQERPSAAPLKEREPSTVAAAAEGPTEPAGEAVPGGLTTLGDQPEPEGGSWGVENVWRSRKKTDRASEMTRFFANEYDS